MNQSQQEDLSRESVNYCYWHPDVETGLSCSQCAKSVCINCMVQAPVGIRCSECGKAVKMPTYDIQRGHYARAVGVGAGVAIGGGLMWALVNFVNFNFFGLPYLPSLIGVAISGGGSRAALFGAAAFEALAKLQVGTTQRSFLESVSLLLLSVYVI